MVSFSRNWDGYKGREVFWKQKRQVDFNLCFRSLAIFPPFFSSISLVSIVD